MKAVVIAVCILAASVAYLTWRVFGPSSFSVGGSGAPVQVREAVASDLPVLIEFTATWCAPCQHIKPIVQELTNDLQGRARVVQVDIDDQPDYSGRNGVSEIPCFIAVRKGKEISRKKGTITKQEMLKMLGL